MRGTGATSLYWTSSGASGAAVRRAGPLPEVLYGRRKVTAWLALNGFPTISKHTVDQPAGQCHSRGIRTGLIRFNDWLINLNRPGMSGDFEPREGWIHARRCAQAVPT